MYFKSDEVKNLVASERSLITNSNKKLELVDSSIQFPLINIETGALENTPAILVKQKN